MFKFKSYNIKKAEQKNKTSSSSSSSTTSSSSSTTSSVPSYSTGTLKKPTSSSSKKTSSSYVSPKKKTMPSAAEINAVSNKHPPQEYSTKIYPKKTVTKWQDNKTYSAKKETTKVVIPSPHRKLERK